MDLGLYTGLVKVDRDSFTFLLKELLYHKIKAVVSLAEAFNIEVPHNRDILGIDEGEFNKIIAMIQDELVRQKKFKERLKEELRKYRIFNLLGYEPIFSVLICGS